MGETPEQLVNKDGICGWSANDTGKTPDWMSANYAEKGKVDTTGLLDLVQDHCEAYLKAKVLPYRPDAWIDHSKIKVGYEIPFNRHFYQYEAPRPLAEVPACIQGWKGENPWRASGTTETGYGPLNLCRLVVRGSFFILVLQCGKALVRYRLPAM